MNIHPAATIFPEMSAPDYQTLKLDIEAHGVREPIWTWHDSIIDGRHRYRACSDLGIACPTREFKGAEDEIVGVVVSLNKNRRHLNASQLALVAAKIADMNQGHRSDLNLGPRGPRLSQPAAAAAVGVSVRAVKRASVVLQKGSPELTAAVESAKITVTEAARIAKVVPKAQQMQAVKKKAPPKAKAPPVPAGFVPQAKYDALVAAYDALEERHRELIDEHEAVDALRNDQLVIKYKQMGVELRTVERTRNDAMNKAAQIQKQITWMQRECKNRGWNLNA